jgi:hypothetical protein
VKRINDVATLIGCQHFFVPTRQLEFEKKLAKINRKRFFGRNFKFVIMTICGFKIS